MLGPLCVILQNPSTILLGYIFPVFSFLVYMMHVLAVEHPASTNKNLIYCWIKTVYLCFIRLVLMTCRTVFKCIHLVSLVHSKYWSSELNMHLKMLKMVKNELGCIICLRFSLLKIRIQYSFLQLRSNETKCLIHQVLEVH